MNDTIFREYDIRGKVGSELIIDEIYDLTCAIIYYFKQQNPEIKTIAVGMDGRIHSLAIKEKMCAALIDSGINVVFLGVCSSPALYFALHSRLEIPCLVNTGLQSAMRESALSESIDLKDRKSTISVDGGFMITASHNGKEYNGIKICLGTRSVWGAEIAVIRELYKNKKKTVAEKKGILAESAIVEVYTEWLVDHFAHLKGIDIAAVVDCGNGAAGTVMPQLMQKMNWPRVQLLYPEVDGTYPNHEADPTVEKNMVDVRRVLATTDMQVGMGLDGDCDRMAAMTEEGFLVPGDQLLALFAQSIIKNNAGAGVVFDIKSSRGLSEVIQMCGGVSIMAPSGHAIIKEHMKKNHALLGGELSCHFFFKDRYFGYDDGIYALLRLLELLHESGQTLTELISFFPRKYSSREFRIFCEDTKKQAVVQSVQHFFAQRTDVTLITIDGVHASMAYGWGIVRPSNTQPALSIRFEGGSAEGLQRVKDDFIMVLQPYMPECDLRHIFNE